MSKWREMLREAKDLFDEGLIDDQEYSEMKQEALALKRNQSTNSGTTGPGNTPARPPRHDSLIGPSGMGTSGFGNTGMGSTGGGLSIDDEFSQKTRFQAVGQTIGNYKVLGEIGQGGMGTVYRARHSVEAFAQQTGDVVIKLMNPQFAQDPTFRQRFITEAATGRSIQHPNVVRIHDVIFEEHKNVLAIVMDLVEGRPLENIIPNGGMPMEQAFPIITQLSEALDHIHEMGIIHRDLKPENIIVSPSGKPVILDMGIAKNTDNNVNMTRTNTAMGTPMYMAPEQMDAKNVTSAADRYAFGLIVYQMLSGQLPWGNGVGKATMTACKMMGNLTPLAELTSFSSQVSNSVMGLLRTNASDRFQSCQQFLNDFMEHDIPAAIEPTSSPKQGVDWLLSEIQNLETNVLGTNDEKLYEASPILSEITDCNELWNSGLITLAEYWQELSRLAAKLGSTNHTVETIGSYELIHDIGWTNVMTTYLARDVQQKHSTGLVVVQVVRPYWVEDASFRHSILVEVSKWLNVQHPNIARVFDVVYDQQSNTLAIVKEFVNGTMLANCIPDGGYPVDRVLSLLDGVTSALDCLISSEIVSFEISPFDIVVDSENNPILTGFEIGRIPKPDFYMFALITGEPSLLETYRDSYGVGDQLSLGLLVYKMLSNQLPWDSDTGPASVCVKQMNRDFIPLKDICNVSDGISTAIMDILYTKSDAFPKTYRWLYDIVQVAVEADKKLFFNFGDRRTYNDNGLGFSLEPAPQYEILRITAHNPSTRETYTYDRLDELTEFCPIRFKAENGKLHIAALKVQRINIWQPGCQSPVFRYDNRSFVGFNVQEGEYILELIHHQTAGTVQIHLNLRANNLESQPKPLDVVEFGNGAGKHEMVLIPKGDFMMGALENDEDAKGNEKPRHKVTLTQDFFMGKYPVTQALWESVMGSNPSSFKGANRPVENVSWFDVVDFCNKLSKREGLTPAYTINGENVTCNWTANGYRLPTEAEWEYSARANQSFKYAGSDNVDEVAWYGEDLFGDGGSGNSGSETHPVGQKKPNGFGLYDMSGNVNEWVWDWKGDYSSGGQTDPTGTISASYRVHRGGSWYYDPWFARVSQRFDNGPARRDYDLGFRIVRKAPNIVGTSVGRLNDNPLEYLEFKPQPVQNQFKSQSTEALHVEVPIKIHGAVDRAEQFSNLGALVLIIGGQKVSLGTSRSNCNARWIEQYFGDDARFWSTDAQFDLLNIDREWFVVPNSDAVNDTMLNGRKITKTTKLYDDDIIGVGKESKGIVKTPMRVRLPNGVRPKNT